jgi:DNA-binding NarL/FixJ family response regulator
MGDLSGARLAVREATEMSSYIDTRSFSALALAVVSLQEHAAQSSEACREALAHVIKLGHVDAVVLACRAYPQLAVCAASDQTLADGLTKAFANSRDIDIGRAAGLEMPRELRKTGGLSTREREVLELLAQGRTKRMENSRLRNWY